MAQPQLTKNIVTSFFSYLVLASGVLTGYCIGLSSIGQFLPRLLAVGTVVSFIFAVYFSLHTSLIKKDVASNNIFFLFSLFICGAALASSISAPPLGHMAEDRFARFIPYSDANGYYQQVLNWPDKSLDSWNSRRPMNAVLNILEFNIGGSTLLGMILLRVSLAAFAIVAFITALARVVGRSSALSAGFVLIIWTWPYASSMQSELNGITISTAGYALLLIALAEKSKKIAYLGLFAIVLAYAFRPYNPLMPGLFAFFVMSIMAENWRNVFKEAIIVAFTFTALAFVIPFIIYVGYGNSDGGVNSNAGSVVLGFARGTDWAEASGYIKSKAPNLSERETNALMYEEAFKTVQKDIRPMGKAIMNNSLQALFVPKREFGFTMGFSRNIPDSAKKTHAGMIRYLTTTPSIWFSSLFMLISSVLIIRNISKGTVVDVLFAITALVFISMAPFIFQDAGWRVVATLYPGFALLITAIPMSIRYRQKKGISIEKIPGETPYPSYLPMALIGFVLIAIPYPAISRFLFNDAKSEAQTVTVDVKNDEVAHWTGLNRAVISSKEMLAWSIDGGYEDLSAFIQKYGNSLRQVRRENGKYVLIYQPKQDMHNRPVLSKIPWIKLQTMPQIVQ